MKNVMNYTTYAGCPVLGGRRKSCPYLLPWGEARRFGFTSDGDYRSVRRSRHGPSGFESLNQIQPSLCVVSNSDTGGCTTSSCMKSAAAATHSASLRHSAAAAGSALQTSFYEKRSNEVWTRRSSSSPSME